MSINELRSVNTFVLTAELGSIRRAAEALDMTPQAASKTLAQFERHLGVRLFHRTTRKMSLTEEGQRFLDVVRPSLVGLTQALQTVKQTKTEHAGPLRIAGPRIAFPSIIGPLLEEYCQEHNEIQPYVLLDDRVGDWVEERVDVGFRIAPTPQEGVVARRLIPFQLVICASQKYIQKYGMPADLEALRTHRCSAYLHPGNGRPAPWFVKVGDEITSLDIVPHLCTNDEELELRAVLSGMVIGQLTSITAAAYIRSGKLIPILTQHVSEPANLFVYYGTRTAQPSRARAFIDLVVKRLANSNEFVPSSSELATRATKPSL